MSILQKRSCSSRSAKCCFLTLLLLCLGSSQAISCPALILAYQIDQLKREDVTRDQIRIYRYQPSIVPLWQAVPFEIDPLDSEGSLLFPEGKSWEKQSLNAFDRISFSHENMGQAYDGKTPAPCQAKQLIEIRSEQKFVYLAVCGDRDLPQGDFASPVEFDPRKRKVVTPFYRYHYSEKNHLVFDLIELSERANNDFIEVAKNSDLLIASDVKNFFTLYFDTEDIDAQINQTRFGPMGLMGGLQFYLKIMMFRLELALLPEVNFFADSLFMPMSMTLPVNAPRYLRRGSGIYYTWQSGSDVEWLLNSSRIEVLDVDHIKPNGKLPLAKAKGKYCNQNICRYNLLGKIRNRLFSLNFAITKKAADLGFFPRLIQDIPQVEQVMGKAISRFPGGNRMGVYFETARLPRGTHTWDFWIHFPETPEATCIKPLQTKSLAI